MKSLASLAVTALLGTTLATSLSFSSQAATKTQLYSQVPSPSPTNTQNPNCPCKNHPQERCLQHMQQQRMGPDQRPRIPEQNWRSPVNPGNMSPWYDRNMNPRR